MLRNKHFLIPAIVAGLWLAAMLALMPAEAIIEKDSAGFLNFADKRTAGYPLFLLAVGTDGVRWVQPLLAALALVYLGFETSRLTGSALVALMVTVGIACFPPNLGYHYTVLSESLFMSLSMVLLGLMMRAVREPDGRALALAALVAGIAAIVRPVALALLPVLIIFALLITPAPVLAVRRLALVAAAALPFIAIVGGEQVAAVWRHADADRVELATRHLFAKSAMLDAPGLDQARPYASRAAEMLAVDSAPIRGLRAKAPDFVTEAFLVEAYEACLQRRCSQEGFGVFPGDEAARAAAWARIRENPRGYLALAWLTYRSLWTTWGVSHPANSARVGAFVAGQRPLPLEPLLPELTAKLPQQWAAVVVQPLFLGIGLATFGLGVLGLFYLLTRRPPAPLAALAATTALGVHGALVLNALTALAIRRYMFGLWPFMAVSLICAGLWLLEKHGPKAWQSWLTRH